MIACTDVFYIDGTDEANAACLLFEDWSSQRAKRAITARIHGVLPYEPGAFYKRELPCLLEVIRQSPDPIDTVVIDGFVWLSADSKPGLGAHLFEALGRSVIVVGVAKTSFMGSDFAVEVLRGESKTPLYVTAAGVDAPTAAAWIRKMAGPFRLPKLLKEVDTLCRKVK